MADDSEAGLKPNIIKTYSDVIDACAKSAAMEMAVECTWLSDGFMNVFRLREVWHHGDGCRVVI